MTSEQKELAKHMRLLSDDEIIKLADEMGLPVKKEGDLLKNREEAIDYLIDRPGGCKNCG